MDSHEQVAVERRLAEIEAAIEAIPKGSPQKQLVERWRSLLEDKEQLESQLADRVAS